MVCLWPILTLYDLSLSCFIVTIESVGSIEPQDLLVQAVQVLLEKCAQVKLALQETLQSE